MTFIPGHLFRNYCSSSLCPLHNAQALSWVLHQPAPERSPSSGCMKDTQPILSNLLRRLHCPGQLPSMLTTATLHGARAMYWHYLVLFK